MKQNNSTELLGESLFQIYNRNGLPDPLPPTPNPYFPSDFFVIGVSLLELDDVGWYLIVLDGMLGIPMFAVVGRSWCVRAPKMAFLLQSSGNIPENPKTKPRCGVCGGLGGSIVLHSVQEEWLESSVELFCFILD